MIQKKKKEKNPTNLDISFEEALKMSTNTPLFKSMEFREMLNSGNDKVWEIKVKKKKDTLFAKLMQVGGFNKPDKPASRIFGMFDVFQNIREVDEEGAKPITEQKLYHQTEIEGVRLTDIKTVSNK